MIKEKKGVDYIVWEWRELKQFLLYPLKAINDDTTQNWHRNHRGLQKAGATMVLPYFEEFGQ